MKTSSAEIIVPGVLSVVGVAALVLWMMVGLVAPLEVRVPGLDGAPPADAEVPRTLPVVGEPITSDGVPSELPGAWPWFRGPNLDGICHDDVPLSRQWPEGGPPKVWNVETGDGYVEMGDGYAAAAVSDGCVYVLDYDLAAEADTMRCLSLDDGREIWRNAYPVVVPWYHGRSRTVSAVAGGHVISFGPMCHVACWDAATGKSHWLIDLVLDYDATVPQWFAGQCPLVDGDRLVLAPGGRALLISVDYASGKVIWESANPGGWVMTHSSIVPMEFAGRRTYVYCGSGGVAGVAADDGEILWDTTAWKIDTATCPTPVALPEGKIFLCGGYKSGAMMLQLRQQGPAVVAEPLFRLTPREFSSVQQTPVFFDGHLFGVREEGRQLVCLDLHGKEVWNSGKDKFGSGPYMIADGLIFVLDDGGRLTMAEATPAAYTRLDRAEVIQDGHDSWGPMAIVAGRLIIRDMTRMVCLDLAEH